MGDNYWRLVDQRQAMLQSAPSLVGKRPRTEYDPSSGYEVTNYYPHDDDRGTLRIRDSDSIGASYDRYLRSMPTAAYGGGQAARPMSGGGLSSRSDDPRMVSMGSMDPGASVKERTHRMDSGKPEVSLPPDASSTLYVEGLPSDCTQREVSHIFRPFVGYKEVRLVSKGSRHPGGDPLILCFVDFLSPAHAATAMDALQGGLLCHPVG